MTGKVAVVTGASGGLGFDMAKILAECGCRVVNAVGVDGVFVGPNDLAADLDCIGDFRLMMS